MCVRVSTCERKEAKRENKIYPAASPISLYNPRLFIFMVCVILVFTHSAMHCWMRGEQLKSLCGLSWSCVMLPVYPQQSYLTSWGMCGYWCRCCSLNGYGRLQNNSRVLSVSQHQPSPLTSVSCHFSCCKVEPSADWHKANCATCMCFMVSPDVVQKHTETIYYLPLYYVQSSFI